MGKKTRIKLVGKGWTDWDIFPSHEGVCEVELMPNDVLKYMGRLWSYSREAFAIEILPDEPAPISEPEKPFEFRVGDKVRCILFGDQVFEVLDNDNDQYPLKIDVINSHVRYTFCRNGFFDEVNKIPVLTLVERPKKTVKKTYWVATYNNQSDNVALGRKNLMTLFDSKEEVVQVLSHLKDVQFHEITREVQK